ncbi:MAG: hypothetical protein J5659_03710 [Clostridia bacterium]|nr:hypothetical protein [Clostridia bacterium]
MKKIISVLSAAVIIFMLCACNDIDTGRTKKNNTKTVDDILNEAAGDDKGASVALSGGIDFVADKLNKENCDIDLTSMNSTMVYSEVNNMMVNPDDYVGKTIKMRGQFSVFGGDKRNYYACIIADATACCSQGIEFISKKERKYPEEYPEIGNEITVVGEFETYFEGDRKYCQLKNALIS